MKGDTTYLIILGGLLIVSLIVANPIIKGTTSTIEGDVETTLKHMARELEIIIMDLSTVEKGVIPYPIPSTGLKITLNNDPKEIIVSYKGNTEKTKVIAPNIKLQGSVQGVETACLVKDFENYENTITIYDGVSSDCKVEFKPLEGTGIPSCVESWSCGPWSNCVNEQQNRVCTDTNNCGVEDNKPEIYRECEDEDCAAIGGVCCENDEDCVGTIISNSDCSNLCCIGFCENSGECNRRCSEDGNCNENCENIVYYLPDDENQENPLSCPSDPDCQVSE